MKFGWVSFYCSTAGGAVCLPEGGERDVHTTEPTYTLYATFDNIGGLKARLRSVLVALLWVGWRILRWTQNLSAARNAGN